MKKEFTGVFRDIIEEMAEIVVVRASLDLDALADDATAIRFRARTNRKLLKALLVDPKESEQVCDEINEAVKKTGIKPMPYGNYSVKELCLAFGEKKVSAI